MKNASEVLKGLTDLGLPEEQAQALVTERIAKGEITDDLTEAAISKSEADLDEQLALLKSAFDGSVEATADGESASVVKGGGEFDQFDDAVEVDAEDLFSAVVKSQAALAEGIQFVHTDTHDALGKVAKGIVGIGYFAKEQAEINKSLAAKVAGMETLLGSIAKSMNVAVVAPKTALTGAAVVPHPSERVAKSEEAPAEGPSREAVLKAIKAEADPIRRAISKGDREVDQVRLGALMRAESALVDGGADPATIVAEHFITVS